MGAFLAGSGVRYARASGRGCGTPGTPSARNSSRTVTSSETRMSQPTASWRGYLGTRRTSHWQTGGNEKATERRRKLRVWLSEYSFSNSFDGGWRKGAARNL